MAFRYHFKRYTSGCIVRIFAFTIATLYVSGVVLVASLFTSPTHTCTEQSVVIQSLSAIKDGESFAVGVVSDDGGWYIVYVDEDTFSGMVVGEEQMLYIERSFFGLSSGSFVSDRCREDNGR